MAIEAAILPQTLSTRTALPPTCTRRTCPSNSAVTRSVPTSSALSRSLLPRPPWTCRRGAGWTKCRTASARMTAASGTTPRRATAWRLPAATSSCRKTAWTSIPERLTLSPWATAQACQRLGIPPDYFRRCSDPLKDANFNHFLWRYDAEPDEDGASPKQVLAPGFSAAKARPCGRCCRTGTCRWTMPT